MPSRSARDGVDRADLLRTAALRLSVLALLVTAACSTVKEVGLRPLYVETEIDGSFDVRRDLAYRDGADAHPTKHRLDLYLPHRSSFPLLVFVHGGSFENGDKSVSLAGLDIYQNIGRFYAARGVAVALVNYRLQPEVLWPSQVDDVARAVSWLSRQVGELGGDGRIYLSGHSAGAWLVARVALDLDQLERPGVDPVPIAGVITVSGSGFDLTDERTWDLLRRGKRDEDYWADRFDSGAEQDWQLDASVLPLVHPGAPPFLLVYTARETIALGRQNELFALALAEKGVPVRLEVLDTDSHRRMALALSHPERRLPALLLDFMGEGSGEEPAATVLAASN